MAEEKKTTEVKTTPKKDKPKKAKKMRTYQQDRTEQVICSWLLGL